MRISGRITDITPIAVGVAVETVGETLVLSADATIMTAEVGQIIAAEVDNGSITRVAGVTDPGWSTAGTPVAARDELAAAVAADTAAQTARVQARERLRAATVAAVEVGGLSEYEAADQAGVTRMTVRSWLGK